MKRIPALVAAFGLAAWPAAAHPTLEDAAPFPETTVRQAPTTIRLSFNEAVITTFSRVNLTRLDGAAVKTGAPVKGKDPRVLTVPVIGRLTPGAYKVEWRVVSKDTHRVEGSYTFSLAK